MGCVKGKQTKKKKSQSAAAAAADPRRDELGVSVGASGTNTSTQSEAAAAGKSQAGGRTPNTETDGTKNIYIYELSNGLRNANFVFRISFRAAAKKKRGNVHSLSIATTPVTAVTRSVPPSGSRSVCPSVRLPLSSPSMATFSRGFTLPSEPKLKDGPHERPQTNHRRPSTWGLQMLISGGPMAIAHTARLPFDPVELRDVRPINAAAWRRASGRASLGRSGGGRGRSEGRRRRRRVPAVNQSNVGLQAGAGA